MEQMTKLKRNVLLIGFMGSGKTTVGRKLSWKLRVPVEDTDSLIEQKAGKTIMKIFETEGEERFREMETEELREICGRTYRRILSVGGGTPVREENRLLLKKCGTVIYLRVKPETVYQRLKGDKTRPLLQTENPLERIRELIMAREKAYEECADVILDVDELDAEECAERLAKWLEVNA